MKGAFEHGTIAEIWKTVDTGKWFDPALRNSLIKNYLKIMKIRAIKDIDLSSIFSVTFTFVSLFPKHGLLISKMSTKILMKFYS